MAMNVDTIELHLLRETSKLWEKYKSQEISIANFLLVVESCQQEVVLFSAKSCELNYIYSELVYWIKYCCKSLIEEIKPMLQLYRVLIQKNVHFVGRPEEIPEVLNDLATKLLETKDYLCELICEVISTLIACCRISKSFANPYWFESSIDIVISHLCKNALIQNNESILLRFIKFFEELARNNYDNYFLQMIIVKNSYGYTMEVLFSLLKMLDTLKPETSDEILRITRRIIDMLIVACRKDVMKIKLTKICSFVLSSSHPQKHDFASEVMQILFKCIEISGVLLFSFVQIMIEIMMLTEFPETLYEIYLEKLKDIKLSPFMLDSKFNANLKETVLRSHNLHNRSQLLDLISSFFFQNFSVVELKLALRFCTKHPEHLGKIFSLILHSCSDINTPSSYLTMCSHFSYSVSVNYNLSQAKELCIWTRINPDSVLEKQLLFKLDTNTNFSFSCYFESNNKDFYIKGFKHNVSIPEKKWSSIFVYLNLKQKVDGKYQIVSIINSTDKTSLCEQLHFIKEITQVSVSIAGNLEYFRLFSTFLSIDDLNYVESKRDLNLSIPAVEKYYSSLIYQLAPSELTSETNFKRIPSQDLRVTRNHNIFESFSVLGGLSCLLPLLKLSEFSTDFITFFQILNKFCQYRLFASMIDKEIFPLLKVLLSEKSNLLNNDWLEHCAGILENIEKTELHSPVFNNIFLCPIVWSRLSSDFTIFYVEMIRVQIFKESKSEIISKINGICDFFLNLLALTQNQSKDLVVGYFFNIITEVFSDKKRSLGIEILTDVIFKIFQEPKIIDYYYNFKEFINEVSKASWKIIRNEELDNILDQLVAIKDHRFIRHQQAIFQFILVIMKKNIIYFKNSNIDSIMYKIKQLMFPCLIPEFSQIIIEFVSDKTVSVSPMSKMIDIITEMLYLTSEENAESFNYILSSLASNAENNQHLCNAISQQNSFPGWIFQFLSKIESQREAFESNSVVLLASQIFSQMRHFTNFDKLRICLQHLLIMERHDWALKLCSLIIYMSDQCFKSSRKYLVEMINVIEDLLSRCNYENIHTELFRDLVITLAKISSTLGFSLNFPRIPAFVGYNYFINPEIQQSKQQILLRNGGICRQLLRFIFVALSFEPNPDLEQLLRNFFSDNKSVEDEVLIEWKDLEGDQSVQKANCVAKLKQKSCINLLYTYIFIEWAEIIRNYSWKGISRERILDSANNLFLFVKQEKILKRIGKEIQLCCDNQNIKQYERIVSENLLDIVPSYLKESQKYYEEIRRNRFKEDRFAEGILFEPSEKHKKYRKSLQEYLDSLQKCTTPVNFQQIICNSNLEIELFFLTLTSFKMKILSEKYFCETIPYTYSCQDIGRIRSETQATITIPFSINENVESIQAKKIFNNLTKLNMSLCGISKDWKKGQYSLKPTFDNMGRRTLMCKKIIQENIDIKHHDGIPLTSSIFEENSTINDTIGTDQIEESAFYSVDSLFDSVPSLEEYNIENDLNYETIAVSPAEVECELITIGGSLYGYAIIFHDFITFQSKSETKPNKPPLITSSDGSKVLSSSALLETQIKKETTKIWHASDIKEIITRRYVHVHCAIEIFFYSGKSTFINFFTTSYRNEAYNRLKRFERLGVRFLKISDLKEYNERWKIGDLSNFDYLLILNKYSGRSFNDLYQYPIFPWILTDYSSARLDLNNPYIFRDLNYPVPAQCDEGKLNARRKFVLSKIEETRQYNYGTHYSTGACVLHYLLRLQPFTNEAKKMQGGCFDLADRLFFSIKKSWENSQRQFSDTKELIPEFFYLPEMLKNFNKINLGIKQDNEPVDDVKLPKWAGGSPYLFLKLHRKALECNNVSKNLHNWIDLVFGFKQKGHIGEAFYNIYYPITYEDYYVEAMKSSPESFHESLFTQALYFGQTPMQLFKKNHPRKEEKCITPPIYERILQRFHFECSKKLSSQYSFVILSTSTLLLILWVSTKCTLSKYKFTNDKKVDMSSLKEVELSDVQVPLRLIASILNEEYIVTAGYSNFVICVHNFSGKLFWVLKLHTMAITCLTAGRLIASSSKDSTIVICTELCSKRKVLHGHLSEVNFVSVMYDHGLVASSSVRLLIHDFRTGQVLNSIEENCLGLLTSSSGICAAILKEEIHLYYINGQLIKSLTRKNNKLCTLIEDCLISDESSCLKVTDLLYKDSSTTIPLQEPLEVTQFHYNAATDSLFFINRHDKFSLYSVEVSDIEKIDFFDD